MDVANASACSPLTALAHIIGRRAEQRLKLPDPSPPRSKVRLPKCGSESAPDWGRRKHRLWRLWEIVPGRNPHGTKSQAAKRSQLQETQQSRFCRKLPDSHTFSLAGEGVALEAIGEAVPAGRVLAHAPGVGEAVTIRPRISRVNHVVVQTGDPGAALHGRADSAAPGDGGLAHDLSDEA